MSKADKDMLCGMMGMIDDSSASFEETSAHDRVSYTSSSHNHSDSSIY